MSIAFEHPGWLLLLLLLIPTWALGWGGRGAHGPTRAIIILGLRSLLLLILSLALAEPIWEQEGEGVTVAVVFDRSRSVPVQLQNQAVHYLEDAARGPGRRPEDQVAVVQVGADAVPSAMPDPASIIDLSTEPADLSETNLARGVELAKGLLPNETANRILLVTDGNETLGSVLAAADLARHSSIPIDVLPLQYEHSREVLIDRLVSPARVREGQSIELTAVIQSQGRASGMLYLQRNGQQVDLDGSTPGSGLPLVLEGGTHVERLSISGSRSGPQEFELVFEADDPSMDAMVRNNTATAVTFVSGGGSVLVVSEGSADSSHLVDSLTRSGLDVHVREPALMGAGLVSLLGHDAILLVNVPRWSFTDQQVQSLRAYVHDGAGGLVMTGGPRSFGAGGWIDSPLAEVLPLKLDPPANRQILRGALALIVHSCEMPEGNYWGQKTAESAIEALSRLDAVGIIEFVNGQGTEWVFPMQEVGDKAAALSATRQLEFGDMPEFAPSMRMALDGLLQIDAGHRHVIVISDGDPSPPSMALIRDFVDAKISISTVMLAAHVPTARATMQDIAQITGGTFYDVTDPNDLPQIFIKEAQLIVRSLIQEGTYQPVTVNNLSGPVAGITGVPVVHGFDLSAPREGLAQTALGIPTEEGMDPLYAWWNHGLGRVVAFTSDVSSRWGSDWLAWSSFDAFWEQTVRWSMRSATPSEFTLATREEEGEVIVALEALDTDASFLNFLQTRASIISPGGGTEPLELQQVGPGRYQGRFSPEVTGTHVVSVRVATPTQDGGLKTGTLHAATSRSFSDEYRHQVHNTALLRMVAERTGGRIFDMNDPIVPDLFDREALQRPRSEQPGWELLAILASALLILDVAVRRLSFDSQRMQEWVDRMSGTRDSTGGASVAAWKRSRKAKGAGPRTASRPSTSEFDAAVREASEPGPEPPPTGPSVEEEEEEPLDTVSRLKAAKDRARREREGGDDA